MSLSWNEIKARAIKFSKEWENATKENADSQPFWVDFFNIFGINQRRVSSFEHSVKKLGDKDGRIDLFWKGTLLIEHKSKGRDLDKAFQQAIDYFPGLKEEELPKYILVSDFENFRLYDLEENTQHNFLLSELHKNIKLFGFIAGYQKVIIREEDPINIQAAEKMGNLHDLLKEIGYDGHNLEIYLVRLLFMLFADDTGIFEKDILWDFIENHTNEDGSDLAPKMAQLFQVLNTPEEKRLKNLDEIYTQFPYVNGKLFDEDLRFASFDSTMRKILLESCYMNWSLISPAIFGSLFQSIMNKTARRNLGAHYTSEKNILKLVKPLFLDELWDEFHKIKKNSKKLGEFHKKLSKLKFLDPACGCGNFLVITYRELRLLEIDVLKEIYKDGKTVLNIADIIWVNIEQVYGIEIEEFPARVAEMAMWMIDHQMNMKISEIFGQYFTRLPLHKAANIINANALKVKWEELVPKEELTYILGNPPFIGKQFQTKEQKEDMKVVFDGVKGAGILDYVTAWYIRTGEYIADTKIKVAFVSTNSISQGEQVGLLWSELFNKYNINIHFAHKSFNWSNEAKNNATVSVIIIGFANYDISKKRIFEYDNYKGQALEKIVKNISPYIIEGTNLVLNKRSTPISDVPNISFGSMPNDGGYLLLNKSEYTEVINKEPKLKDYIKTFMGGAEFLNKIDRYCFWLIGISPNIIKNSKILSERIRAVKELRGSSSRKGTIELAKFPSLFGENRQPKTEYIVVPLNTSSARLYLPIGLNNKEIIASNLVSVIPTDSKYVLGVLSSSMQMTWMRYICGRLGNGYRYSNTIVYNNYPWPLDPSEKNKKKVEEKAQKVLDVRAEFPESSLADLYDPLTMPPKLVKAHNELDKAVDLCYRPQAFTSETGRIEFLFDLYNEYAAGLFKVEKKVRKRKRNKEEV